MKPKMNRLLSVLLALLMATSFLPAFTAFAEDVPAVVATGYCGGEGDGTNLTWTLTDDGTLAVSGTGAMADYGNVIYANSPLYSEYWNNVEILSLVVNEGVTAIGTYGFNNFRHLVNVSLPESLTSIHDYAFNYCERLEAITIPAGVTDIGKGAFSYCCKLERIAISAGVTQIRDNTFAGCHDLFEITVPEGVTGIGSAAFSGCYALENIALPESVTSVGDYAFSSYLSGMTLSKNVVSIGKKAFSNVPLTIDPENPVYFNDVYGSLLQRGADGNCFISASRNTPSDYAVPNDVTQIASEAFSSVQLTSVTLPDHFTQIDPGAFSGCSKLESIVLPAGVTQIGDRAFSRCTSLTGISLPNGLTRIGESAFDGCSALAEITLPASLETIGKSAFCECTALTQIDFPESLTALGDSAFYECTGLTALSVGTGLTSIGKSVFGNCDHVATVWIPASVTQISSNAFNGCVSITAFSVDPENPAFFSDADGCLYNKDKTVLVRYPVGKTDTAFEIPGTVTEIASCAFESKVRLKDETYPSYTGHLESITVPASVTSIGYGALANNRWRLRFIKILNPDCSLTYESYAYLIDGWQFPERGVLYGYLGSTAEASTQDFYYGTNIFRALCPTNDAHNVIKAEAAAATCTVSGHTAGWYCEDCGVWLNGETIDPLGHPNAQNVAAAEATADEHGYTAGVYCPDCGVWVSGHEVIHNHLGETTVVKPATATEEGLVDIVCTVCGEKIRYTASATGPEPDEEEGGFAGFWARITGFFRGIIDWFLRLFRRP